MLIAIVALGLVVVFMASNKKLDQLGPSQQGLPPDNNIPSQGTTGVPSPGTMQTDNPAGTTQRGLLAMQTNVGFLAPKYGPNKIAAHVATDVVSSTPQGPPDGLKSLDTQSRASALTQIYKVPTGMRKL